MVPPIGGVSGHNGVRVRASACEDIEVHIHLLSFCAHARHVINEPESAICALAV